MRESRLVREERERKERMRRRPSRRSPPDGRAPRGSPVRVRNVILGDTYPNWVNQNEKLINSIESIVLWVNHFLRLMKTMLQKVLDREARDDRVTIVESGIENDEIVLKGMMSEKTDVELRLDERENLHRHLLRAPRLLARMTTPKGIGRG